MKEFREASLPEIPPLDVVQKNPPMIEFEYKGDLVGKIDFKEFPDGSELTAYMPFRGIGHLNLCEDLEKGKERKCNLNDGDETEFVVEEIVTPRSLKIRKTN